MLVLSVASLVLLLAQAAPASKGATAPPPSPAASESAATPSPPKGRVKKDGRICRAEPVLGSRMPVTICATAEEWEARRQNDKETLDKIQHGIRNPSG